MNADHEQGVAVTGRWIFKCLIGWQWAIWRGDETYASEYGWCWTRKAARRKAGIDMWFT